MDCSRTKSEVPLSCKVGTSLNLATVEVTLMSLFLVRCHLLNSSDSRRVHSEKNYSLDIVDANVGSQN
jgi:hypothetical protein